MKAQYTKDDKVIRLYNGYWIVGEIAGDQRRAFGFPPFSQWERTWYGYELSFEVVAE